MAGGSVGGSRFQSGSTFKHVGQRVGDVVAVERALAGQALVEHAAERPHVHAPVDRGRPARLLGRHAVGVPSKRRRHRS